MSTKSRSASPVRHPLVVKDTNSNSNNNSNCNTPTKSLSLSASASTSASNSPSKKRSTYSHHDENSPSFKKTSPNKNSNLPTTRPSSSLRSSSSLYTTDSIKNIHSTGLTPLKSASKGKDNNNKIKVFSPSSSATNSLSSLSLSASKADSINPLPSSSSSSKRINNKLLQFQLYEDPKPYVKSTQLTSDTEKEAKNSAKNSVNDQNKPPMIKQDVKKDLQYKIRNREKFPGVLKDLNIRKFPGFISPSLPQSNPNDIASSNGILSNKFQLMNTWVYEFDNNKRQNLNVSNNSQDSIENVLASSSTLSKKGKEFNIPSYITPPKGNRVKYIDTLNRFDNCVKDLSNQTTSSTAPHDTISHDCNNAYSNNRRKSIGESTQNNKDTTTTALNFMIFNENIDK
ncbi:hypothetical protein B5S33_g406 [[Candida] boidinii]|nr:hypothetical protein B5S33_g406 [[Candida] boidinii]